MKLFIASDIHGSAYYCEQLIEAIQRENSDQILFLGDLLYHGPRNDLPEGYAPKKVIELLHALPTAPLCVRGNCEAEVDQMVLNFPVLAEYAWLHINGLRIFATHGHHHGENTPPPLKKGDILLNGHTHIPAWTDYGDYYYLNPGSVSIPKEGSAHSYMVLEEQMFLWKDLNGNVYHTLSMADANGN